MSAGQERDEWLMMQVAQGQAEQIEPLVRRYGTLLLTFIQRMIGDRHRSEEMFQDVFLAVWTKRAQYKFGRPFKPWLYKIALNRCRRAFRVRGLGPVTPLDEESWPRRAVSTAPSPPESAIATETATLVEQSVALLPPKQRMIVVMRLWNNLEYEQIAAALGVREATVRSNMHDALANIRRYLESRL